MFDVLYVLCSDHCLGLRTLYRTSLSPNPLLPLRFHPSILPVFIDTSNALLQYSSTFSLVAFQPE